MAKHSSRSVVFLVDGYNILGAKPQGLTSKVGVVTERTDGLSDGWHEHSPTGDRFAELAQEGAFFNTGPGNIHAALGNPSAEPEGPKRIACAGFAGNVIGQPFTGFEGAIQGEYEILSTRGQLQRANATYMVSGAAEDGVILHEHSTETADDSTEDESVDHAAEPQVAVPIVSSSVANPSVITTSVPHGLVSGDSVIISGHTSVTPDINGEHVATVTGPTTFTIPVNVTDGGVGGQFVRGKTQAGGVGYLQAEEVTLGGHTGALVALRDSSDDVVFADLGVFVAVTARGAQRIEVAGVVERYLAQSLDFQGAGSGPSIKYFCGFARN